MAAACRHPAPLQALPSPPHAGPAPPSLQALLLRSEAKKLDEDFQGSLNDVHEARQEKPNNCRVEMRVQGADADGAVHCGFEINEAIRR